MFCLFDMLWENENFIGRSYPPEISEKLLKSMAAFESLDPAGFISGMTLSEFSVICCAQGHMLKNSGQPAAVAEIAKQMSVSMPAVSRTLRTLQAKGWISRQNDDADRRSVKVTVTPEGAKIAGENLDRIAKAFNRAMSVFTEEEMRTIAELYSKFAAAMTQQPESGKERSI